MSSSAEIKVVFSAEKPGSPSWPYIDYDYKSRAEQIMHSLKKDIPDIRFDPVILDDTKKSQKITAYSCDYDGFLVYMTGGM
ncbi:MAG: hypothetical protein ACOCZT_01380 [Halanaerobiales bacterium]